MNFMKIAIITDHIPSQWAHSMNTMKIAQGFHELGHDVEVLVVRRYIGDKKKLKVKEIHNFYDINKSIKIHYFRDYTPYYFKEIRYLGPFLKIMTDIIIRRSNVIRYIIDPERRISRYCKQYKFELAFCRRTFNALYYNILNEIPSILDVHDHKVSELKYVVNLNNFRFFKGIMTINKELKKKLTEQSFNRNKIIFMDNGVNLDKFNRITNDKIKIRKKLKLPLDKKIILYSGGLYDNRGIDVIINGAQYLDSRKYSFYFLGGDKKIINKWKNFIVKSKNMGDINFIGFKERFIVPYYLKAADLLLATYSSNCPTLNIMSPVKIIEYMASKVPFIATKIGRNIELCNNNECTFIEPNNSKDLSEKIKLILENADLRKKIVRNAYNKAKEYSIKKRCRKILKLYK